MEGWGRGKSGRKIKLLICIISCFAGEDFKAVFDFCDHLLQFKITNGYVKWKKKKGKEEKTLKIFSPFSVFFYSHYVKAFEVLPTSVNFCL